jgi:hypothetical protein
LSDLENRRRSVDHEFEIAALEQIVNLDGGPVGTVGCLLRQGPPYI